MKQRPILDVTMEADAAITAANLCLVASGTNPGNCAVAPIAAGTIGFCGISLEPTISTSKSFSLAVRVAGIVQCTSDGAGTITAGQYVGLSTTTAGNVKQVTVAFGGTNLSNVVGIAMSSTAATAGLLVDVLLYPQVIKL